MKFSHSIQFNAVPDWSSSYIAYSNLKKLIYTLERETVQLRARGDDTESSSLVPLDTDSVFRKALDSELDKILTFYNRKEAELLGEVRELEKDARAFDDRRSPDMDLETGGRSWKAGSDAEDSGSDDEEEDNDALLHRQGSREAMKRRVSEASHGSAETRRKSAAWEEEDEVDVLYDIRVTLKKRAILLFVALRELKSYAQLNKTGFRKACKKYDKILDRNLKTKYLSEKVAPAYPFLPETAKTLEENIGTVEELYAVSVTDGDVQTARKELRLHLREHVVWERNTVWRDMIGIERKAHTALVGGKGTLLGDGPQQARLAGDDLVQDGAKELSTPVGRLRVPRWMLSANFCILTIIIVVFAVLVNMQLFDDPMKQNCFAMLVFVSLLWATEVIPLFVTSLMIPFLVVLLGVVRDDQAPYERLGSKAAAKYIFSAMWTPVIMLLLGGFTLASALSKYGIAKRMAVFVLAKAGTRPRTVLVTNMFVAMFASMWISNVAAPVLCFSIIQPMLRNLPSDSEFSKALILGIALASNIGGMASPIASPQNIIALENMSPAPSWGAWFFVSLPVCIISILLIWVVLLVTFRIGNNTTIVPIRPTKDAFTGVEYFIMITTFVTIILWCISHQLEHIFGDMGVVAIIPIVLFFGSGILTKDDFNNFLWTIIILAAGGLSLGKAVDSSGLLQAIAQSISKNVEGYSLYAVLCVFCGIILVIATFISHTVAALIFLPIVAQVGNAMENPHPNLLVMGSALMCSAAMGLPTSGFPNMTAVMMEDPQTGLRYLRVQHFITRGILGSVLTFVVVVTVGYAAMRVAGF